MYVCVRVYISVCVYVYVCMYACMGVGYIIQLNYLIYTADNARTRLSQTDDESDYVNACSIDVSQSFNIACVDLMKYINSKERCKSLLQNKNKICLLAMSLTAN